MSAKPAYVIVIGASAGGLTALSKLVSQFQEGMDAAVLIVLHLSRRTISDYVVQRLQLSTTFRCSTAINGEPIEKKRIYIAAPNHHLLVKKDSIIIGQGPEENRWRPCIDVLFRSAAAAYGTRAIGILLTGLMDDGTSGMWAIKRSGGTCIVQDPEEAEYSEMPLSVLDNMEVDYCVKIADMGPVIMAQTSAAPRKEMPIPKEVLAESKIAEKVAIGTENLESISVQTVFACPDCGGGLWGVTGDDINRYRCHIGHSYTEKDLVLKQVESLESTLWISLRMMEERRKLLMKIRDETGKKGLVRIAAENERKATDLEVHINKLKELLFETQNDGYTEGS